MKSKLFLFFAIVSAAGMLAISGCQREVEQPGQGDNVNPATLSATGNFNGHAYIDLGLPSGTLWATCNIGASNPEDFGDYFAWGETTEKDTYTLENYLYYNSDRDYMTKYSYVDILTTLEASDDAATANWGTGWRMPTSREMQEMVDNCDSIRATYNGVKGMLYTSRINGNSIFLPAAGYDCGGEVDNSGIFGKYWSNNCSLSPHEHGLNCADILRFFMPEPELLFSVHYESRYYGLSVRPVYNPNASLSTPYDLPTGYVNGYGYVDLGLPSGTLWATCNVGANTPTECGNLYAWGETTPKETYYWSNYVHCNGDRDLLTKYCRDAINGYNGFTDNLTTLEASDDAATTNWGNGWRMPTSIEIEELVSNTVCRAICINGVRGMLVTGVTSEHSSEHFSIFLPCMPYQGSGTSSGQYWSSTLSYYSDYAKTCVFSGYDESYLNGSWSHLNYGTSYAEYDRAYACLVRPVCAR